MPPLPMYREKGGGFVLGYMDLIDFEFELGAASGGSRIFASPQECREYKKCVGECGIVEVKVEAIRVVLRQALFDDNLHTEEGGGDAD